MVVSSATSTGASQTTGSIRIEQLLLPVFAVVGGVSVLKGLGPSVSAGIEFYWLLGYEHGFIRRALIGTLFRPLVRLWSYDQLRPVIFTLHVAACAAIVSFCYVLIQRVVEAQESVEIRITLAIAFLCLMCSPLMPTLGHDVGYVDVYVILLVLLGCWFVLRGKYVLAALPWLAGPLVHESFIFMWTPVALVLTWSAVTTRRQAWQKVLVSAAPILSTAAVVLLQTDLAAAGAIDTLQVSDTIKEGLRAYQLQQTVSGSFAMMLRYQFPGNGPHITTSLAYFLPPSAAIVGAAAFCHWRRWRARALTLVVLVVAAMAPLTAMAFAWDLSRFV